MKNKAERREERRFWRAGACYGRKTAYLPEFFPSTPDSFRRQRIVLFPSLACFSPPTQSSCRGGRGRLMGEFAPCAERPSSLCPPTVSTCFNGDALRCPCLNSTTERNLTSELEALALSPQGEPSGLISPQTSFFPCKARSSCVTARLVEGSLYASASDTMDNTTTVNLARGGHSQLKTSEPSTGRGIRLSLWMVRPIECPRRLW